MKLHLNISLFSAVTRVLICNRRVRTSVTSALSAVTKGLPLVALLGVCSPGVARAETLLFGTGFEASTYSPGPIGGGYYAEPQFTSALGWYAWPLLPYSADPSPWATVTDTRAASGSQSLKLLVEPSNGQIGVSRSYPSGSMVLSAGFGVSTRLYVDQASDSDVNWNISFSDSYAGLLGMTFTPSGQVMYGHRFMSTSAFYNTGFDLRNTWLDVSMEVNPTDASSILLSVSNGTQSWQQSVGSPGGEATRFSIGGNYPTFPLYKTGAAYVDDLRLGYNLLPAPEPTSATLLLIGVLCAATLRRSARK